MSICTAPPVSLESILYNRSTDQFRQFTAFVHSTFCTENLAFWLAVQHYHDLCHRLIDYHNGSSTSLTLLEEDQRRWSWCCCCSSWTAHQGNINKHNTVNYYFLPPSLNSTVSFHDRASDSNTTTTTPSPPAAPHFGEIQEACRAILRNHIRANSPQEINIPCEMRQEILHRVEKDGNYHPAIFLPATESVLELMRANSFIPWCSSLTASAPASPLLPPSQQEQLGKQCAIGARPAAAAAAAEVTPPSHEESILRRWLLKHRRRFGINSSSSSSSSNSGRDNSNCRRSSSSDDLYLVPARPYLSAPSTPRSSGESFRNWSPWRKIHLHR